MNNINKTLEEVISQLKNETIYEMCFQLQQ